MPGITRDEYELHLRDLSERLRAHLESGEDKGEELMREAEELLELGPEFPDVLERHGEIEGLVAELLARRQQEKFIATQQPEKESSGGLLGWLFGRR